MLLIFFFAFLVRVRYQVSDGLNGEFFFIGWTLIGLVFSNQTKTALSWEVSDDFEWGIFFHWLDFDWTSFSNQAKTALSWERFFNQLLCLLVGVAFAKIVTKKTRLALHPLGAFPNQMKGSICWWWGFGFGFGLFMCAMNQINTFRLKLSIKARVPFVVGGALDLVYLYVL